MRTDTPTLDAPGRAPGAATDDERGGGTGFFPFPFLGGAMTMGKGWGKVRD